MAVQHGDALRVLGEKLGVRFRDPGLLQRALVHASHINEDPSSGHVSNERLEFLGDAVLGQTMALLLYRAMPQATEGDLTRARSALVRRETLAEVARDLDLGAHLVLGKGEEAGGGRERPANLADALEALLGAVYLDQGEDVTHAVIERLFGPVMERLHQEGEPAWDAKSRLQELVQARYKTTPTYRVIKEQEADAASRFTVEVLLGDQPLAQGAGASKRAAEQEAAQAALLDVAVDGPALSS